MFTISDNAEKRIIAIREENKNQYFALKIMVDGGGCSGFKYDIESIDDYREYINDNTFEKFESENDGIIVIVDKYSIDNFIGNARIDFIKSLGSKYFEIINPDAKAGCGCGVSFSI